VLSRYRSIISLLEEHRRPPPVLVSSSLGQEVRESKGEREEEIGGL